VATTARVSPAQKVFYAAVGTLALWVGAWGYLAPAHVDWALPWIVPPLHARFLGAMYLSGATFMAGALLAQQWSSIRVVVPMISIWTGMLFIVSLLYLPEFDWRRQQVWIWFTAYLAFPLTAAGIAWRMRAVTDRGNGPPSPSTLRLYLLIQGTVVTSLALGLLFFPQAAVALWPWRITPLLAQLYSAPFLSYGLGSLYAAQQPTFAEVRIFLAGTLVFVGGVLLGSLLHLPTFAAFDLADWLWFVGFGVATGALVAWCALPLTWRQRHFAPDGLGRV
jgi:hypothetical protein